MTNKTNGPLGPIVRKGGKSDEAADEAGKDTKPETPAAMVSPKPVLRAAAQKEVLPSGTVDEDVKLSRRVVDPALAKPKAKRKEPVHETKVEQGTLEDFEALLAGAEATEIPRVRFSIGDQVDATVVSVGEKYVYFELPGRAEALAHRAEYTNKDGAIEVEDGDALKVYIVDMRSGIQVGKKLSTAGFAADAIEAAYSSGVPVEGRVTGTNKGGYEVEIQGVRAFCPLSQIELNFTEDPDVHLNKSYLFRVTKFGEDGRNVVVSRSALLQEERQAAAAETLATLQPGMTIPGVITRIADFGAFVDIGGIEGLVHISQLGFSRVEHPSEAVKEGEQVNVKILSLEETKDGLRIGLSMKETMENPWDSDVSNYVVGQKVTGTVVRVENFGAFVELSPGLEGLVHVSEMSWDKHIKHPSDVVNVGDAISVEIQSIDIVRQRISLSMKGAGKDPWSAIEDHFAIGLEVEGTIENVEDFGVFVALQHGVTALIPRSEMGLERDATPHRKFSKGNKVNARVLSIEKDRRRMALTMKSADEMEADQDRANAPKSYSDNEGSGFGTLGDLLKNKMK